jgi:hypothetical protein
MGTVRKLAALLACTAVLSVFGATTAGAEQGGKCDRLAKITERIEVKKARIAARAAERPRAATVGQNHKPDSETKLQDKLGALKARCSG